MRDGAGGDRRMQLEADPEPAEPRQVAQPEIADAVAEVQTVARRVVHHHDPAMVTSPASLAIGEAISIASREVWNRYSHTSAWWLISSV